MDSQLAALRESAGQGNPGDIMNAVITDEEVRSTLDCDCVVNSNIPVPDGVSACMIDNALFGASLE